MTKKILLTGLVLLVVAVVAVAADAITGKWAYEAPARGGGGGGGGAAGGGAPRIVTLELKADGANLTGTILQPAGGGRGGGGGGAAPAAPTAPTPTPIANGKVNGNSITFEVTRQGQNGATTTKYEGTVSGAELKLKITAPGRGGGDPTTTEVTAKKS